MLNIPVIEASNSGARVILPDWIIKEGKELMLIHICGGVEFRSEYRVTWSRKLVGHKVVAGLQCLLSTETKAA